MSVKLLVSDWGAFDTVFPVAVRYGVGLEIQEFASPENLDHHRALAEDFGERLTALSQRSLHGPYHDLVPASDDPRVREVARSRFQEALGVARTVGAGHVVLHSGFFPKTYPRDMWIENSLEFWAGFLPGMPRSIDLHLENVYEDDYSPLAELADRVNDRHHAEALTLCLDIGHVNANSSRGLADWISGLGNRIRYVHLHSNDGFLDDHWGLWKGRLDMRRVLDLLLKHAPAAAWTVETVLGDIEPSLAWLKQNGLG